VSVNRLAANFKSKFCNFCIFVTFFQHDQIIAPEKPVSFFHRLFIFFLTEATGMCREIFTIFLNNFCLTIPGSWTKGDG